jgi:hypothetical protein
MLDKTRASRQYSGAPGTESPQRESRRSIAAADILRRPPPVYPPPKYSPPISPPPVNPPQKRFTFPAKPRGSLSEDMRAVGLDDDDIDEIRKPDGNIVRVHPVLRRSGPDQVIGAEHRSPTMRPTHSSLEALARPSHSSNRSISSSGSSSTSNGRDSKSNSGGSGSPRGGGSVEGSSLGRSRMRGVGPEGPRLRGLVGLSNLGNTCFMNRLRQLHNIFASPRLLLAYTAHLGTPLQLFTVPGLDAGVSPVL